jgi:hypothetical protein
MFSKYTIANSNAMNRLMEKTQLLANQRSSEKKFSSVDDNMLIQIFDAIFIIRELHETVSSVSCTFSRDQQQIDTVEPMSPEIKTKN